MGSQCLSRLGYRELARGVLQVPISLAARDSVPKAVLRSSSSSRSKSITSIAIGWFEEERSHNHGQESRWKEKEHLCPNLYPIWNYLYYSRYSELPTRPSGWPACWDHCCIAVLGVINIRNILSTNSTCLDPPFPAHQSFVFWRRFLLSPFGKLPMIFVTCARVCFFFFQRYGGPPSSRLSLEPSSYHNLTMSRHCVHVPPLPPLSCEQLLGRPASVSLLGSPPLSPPLSSAGQAVSIFGTSQRTSKRDKRCRGLTNHFTRRRDEPLFHAGCQQRGASEFLRSPIREIGA